MLIPVVLSGPPPHLMGTAQVEQLQQALKNLATATQRPGADPGAVTGVVNDTTMIALNNALGLITEQLPSAVYLTLQAGMIAGATTSYAKNLVSSYAPQLTVAINTAAVKYKTQPTPATTPLPPIVVQQPSTNPISQLFAPGWYKQPWGIALIALGLFGAYKIFLSSPSRAPARS